eukprot:776007_1
MKLLVIGTCTEDSDSLSERLALLPFNPNAIQKLEVDDHPLFRDHRPLIFTLNNSNVKIIDIQETYLFNKEPLPDTADLCDQTIHQNTKILRKIESIFRKHIDPLLTEKKKKK